MMSHTSLAWGDVWRCSAADHMDVLDTLSRLTTSVRTAEDADKAARTKQAADASLAGLDAKVRTCEDTGHNHGADGGHRATRVIFFSSLVTKGRRSLPHAACLHHLLNRRYCLRASTSMARLLWALLCYCTLQSSENMYLGLAWLYTRMW